MKHLTSTRLSKWKKVYVIWMMISNENENEQNKTCVVSSTSCIECFHCIFFSEIFDIDVSIQMISEITAHIQLFDFSVLTKFSEDVLIELFEVTLSCFDIKEGFSCWSVLIVGCLVHVGINDCLTFCGFVVKTWTSFTVTTCTNFEIKWTVHSVDNEMRERRSHKQRNKTTREKKNNNGKEKNWKQIVNSL